MKSRYDFMKEGSVRDAIDGSVYPDPLTLNFNIFSASEKPHALELQSFDIERMWMVPYRYYSTPEYDDMLLSLNGIAHTNHLAEGDVLLIPLVEDIEGSFRQLEGY